MPEILPALSQLLAVPHEHIVLLACWLISNLSALGMEPAIFFECFLIIFAGDEDVREQICAEALLGNLSNVLRRKFNDPQTKETALWAITNLSLSSTARGAMADAGVRAVLTQLFIQGDPIYRPKAIQALRNFLVDGALEFRSRFVSLIPGPDEFCLEFYETEALGPTVLMLEHSDPATVELALACVVILSDVLEGLPLELVDTFGILKATSHVMRQMSEDSLQELTLQLSLQLFLSGEADGPICSSDLVSIATERLNWLSRSVQHNAIAFLSHVSVNCACFSPSASFRSLAFSAVARETIKVNPQWASMTLTLTAATDAAAQESALRLLANMSVDAPCRKILREKTNSVKILSALCDSLDGDALELCQLALSNLNVFDPADGPMAKRASFREARPSSQAFGILDRPLIPTKFSEADDTMKISYPGDPRLNLSSSRGSESFLKASVDVLTVETPPATAAEVIVASTGDPSTTPSAVPEPSAVPALGDASEAPRIRSPHSWVQSRPIVMTSPPSVSPIQLGSIPTSNPVSPRDEIASPRSETPPLTPVPSTSEAGLSGAVQGISGEAAASLSVTGASQSLSGVSLMQVAQNAFGSAPEIDAATAKLLKQRDGIAQELLLTETAYLATLTAIQSAFRAFSFSLSSCSDSSQTLSCCLCGMLLRVASLCSWILRS